MIANNCFGCLGYKIKSTFLKFSFFLLACSFSALPFTHAQTDPPEFTARGFDSHVELQWDHTLDGIQGYRIYRAEDGDDQFELLQFANRNATPFLDFTGFNDFPRDYAYYLVAVPSFGDPSLPSDTLTVETRPFSDDELLDMVQEYTFRYFWDFGHPVSGLARERNTSGETVTMGGSGFGVMAILVGIERGYINWEEGLDRLLKVVLFLEDADRFYGVFPHWMNGSTGEVRPFSSLDNGGDIVETAFLFEGLLTVREYFDGNTANEVVLRQKITSMWEQINWDWYRNGGNVMLWHWSPQHEFAINLKVRGWNETMMVYLLGIASPTQGIPSSLYETGWAGGNYVNGFSIYGYPLFVGSVTGGPLFFAHYSFIGFDPRGIQDDYANYFIHNRNHTLVNRAYCIDNPKNHIGYSDVCWGLTASDDPIVGYLAHEPKPDRDNGTIAPTAALSSMPYTPEESMAAMKHFYRELGDRLWGPMGFYDAFNFNEDWFASSYIAIDQGPIICMIENYRSELLWNTFMANPEIEIALEKIGFVEDTTTATRDILPEESIVFPNPAFDVLYIDIPGIEQADYQLRLLDRSGNQISTIKDINAGDGSLTLDIRPLSPGIYFLKVDTDHQRILKKVLILDH